MRESLRGRKPILITAMAFKDLMYSEYDNDIAEKLFKEYFVYFTLKDWKEIANNTAVDSSGRAKILRQFWWSWSVTEKTLQELNAFVYPDEIYYCGYYLEDLYNANLIIGDDMIFSPAELANHLN